MKSRCRILTVLIFAWVATAARAELVVVVNPANPADSLSRREVVDLFMGRTQYFADGSLVLRLDQQPQSQERQDFYRGLVNKSVAEVNAYWAKLLFSGRASPPQVVDGNKAVLAAVRDNKNAIGYMDSAAVDDSVKVVARVD
jgi:ABC-type phosphate transport system substrate-binding protein